MQKSECIKDVYGIDCIKSLVHRTLLFVRIMILFQITDSKKGMNRHNGESTRSLRRQPGVG